MILFIDEPRNIKLVRHSPEDGTRDPLGKIKKQAPEVSDEIRERLKDGEEAEIAAALELISEGEAARIKTAVASFPITIREVLAYYQAEAKPSEQRWILGALLEGLRVIRRYERDQTG